MVLHILMFRILDRRREYKFLVWVIYIFFFNDLTIWNVII
jgi:hypothetical protein